MKHMNKYVFAILSILLIFAITNDSLAQRGGRGRGGRSGRGESITFQIERIKLPPGFSIEVYAENVRNARSMALSPSGTVFVGTRARAGNVYAILDNDKDHKADEVIIIASGLNSPNGVAFKDGSLYVAERSRIIRYDNIESNLRNSPEYKVVLDEIPAEGGHSWKYLSFGPDGMLYFNNGGPGNNPLRLDEPRYATIIRVNPDGSGFEIYAHGVRQSVGHDWDPRTGELWFTDNGRDRLGDDSPPDELNHATRIGQHFGFPYFFGKDIPDPDHGEKRPLSDFEPVAMALAPHAAAVGMKFYTGDMFPDEYKNVIFIAEHGSWDIYDQPYNGYKISTVRVENNVAVSYETFAEGWLLEDGRRRFGRPADVRVLADGSMLVSDDMAHVLYRITYNK